MKKSLHTLLAGAVVASLLGVSLLAAEPAEAATPPNLADLWAGSAHFELAVNRPMDGQAASGSNIVVVGSSWYWFHRNVVDVATWKLGTVVERSTDQGRTWTAPVAVVQPTAGTAWAQMVTDGSFYYDATANKWRAILQTNDGANAWTMSYFERAGSDPMGAFTTPAGFSNPAVSAKEIWSQITTTAGRDAVDIPAGTNQVFDEGTPQIVGKIGADWYVTFHGASATGGTTHGYRGIAKTSDFQNWVPAAQDAIVDEYDAQRWNVPWNPGGPIGVGAANIMQEGGYYYQIIEGADVNLNGFAGQNWPMGLMRSSSLTSTDWESATGGALFPAAGQVIEWQYPTFFKDAAGVTYVAISKYAPDSDAGFRIYRLVAGSATAQLGVNNGVVNPSFETDRDWALGAATRSTDRARSGDYSLKLTVDGSNVKAAAIRVQPYTAYQLSGWVYKTNGAGNAYLDLNDISGEPSVGVSSGSGAGTWTYVSQAWSSGSESSVVVRAVVDSGITGAAYFDDVALIKTEPGNTLLNPSFENATTSSPAWAAGTMTVSTERPHLGSRSLKTTSPVAAEAHASAPIYVQPYTAYVLSGWIYKSNSAGSAYFDMDDLPGEAQVGVAAGAGGGTWTHVTQSWNSGPNWSLRIRCVTDGGLTAAAYFDDVSLARQGGYTGEIAFGTGLESGHTALTWSDVSDSIVNVSTPLSSLRTNESSRSGSASLRVSGTDNNATISYAINRVFDVDIPVTATTKLSYWALPTNENGRHVVVDLIFTDGSTLRDSGAVDFEGISMHPNVARGIVGTWRQVQSKIGQWTAGKTIDRIIVDYDYPLGTGGYNAYLDDIYIQN